MFDLEQEILFEQLKMSLVSKDYMSDEELIEWLKDADSESLREIKPYLIAQGRFEVINAVYDKPHKAKD